MDLGTAVSVYCALAAYIEWNTVATQLNFFIDGENLTSQAYYSSPAINETYTYNVQVFSSNPLSSGSHTLTVESWAAFLFDRIVYTCVNLSCLLHDWTFLTRNDVTARSRQLRHHLTLLLLLLLRPL